MKPETATHGTTDFVMDLTSELLQTPVEAVAVHLIGRLCDHFGARHVCVHLSESGLAEAFPESLHRCPPGSAPPEEKAGLMDSEASWLQHSVRTGRPVSLAEARSAVPDSVALCETFAFTDGLSVPLTSRGEILGTLNLYLESGTLLPADVRSLSGLGGVLYGLVKRSQMERRVQDRDGIIRSFARAVEVRDPYTGGHLDRVRRYAGNIARAFGLSADEISAIEEAAYLHDIGKIGVPDAVLTKEGGLTPSDWEAMKRHPAEGRKIFEGISDPQLIQALPGILWHHERIDGAGYPDGLSGEAIPLIARIVGVADAYDAMTSHRPYRRSLPHDVAVRNLWEQAGKQFDADVVRRFVQFECYRIA